MRRLQTLIARAVAVGALALLLISCKTLSSVVTPQAPIDNSFVGSATCGTCHADLFNEFLKSGHPYKVRTLADAQNAPNQGLPEIPTSEFPGIGQAGSGVQIESDILFVLGGVNWKARMVNVGGFVVEGPLAQFNLVSQSWGKYNKDTWMGADEPYNYDCFKCHTTGASPTGHPANYPQISGSWEFLGVQCERCHGMGFRHVNYREPPVNLTPINTCDQCHNRNDTAATILANGNFLAHRDQTNEFRNNAMASAQGMNCVSCHNPHRRAKLELGNSLCASCHGNLAATTLASMHSAANVGCTDCHMAEIVKNGAAKFENAANGTFRADEKSHVFRITPDPAYAMLVANPDTNTNVKWPKIMNRANDSRGKAGPFITLGYACGKCHSNNTPALFGQAIVNNGGSTHTLDAGDTPPGWLSP